MPLAFIFVAIIMMVNGWYQMENHRRDIELIQESESEAIALMISAEHLRLMRCARYKDAAGNEPNWAAFSSFTGPGSTFLSANCPASTAPEWMQNIAKINSAGTSMPFTITVNSGKVTVDLTSGHTNLARKAGVQAHLNKMSDYSIVLGQPISGY